MLNKNNTIEQKGEGNFAIQNSQLHITISIYDEIKRLAREGKRNEVVSLLKEVHDLVGTTHPLYPHYRYKPVQFGDTTVLEHEPLTKEAEEKYPLHYRGQFSFPKDKMQQYENIQEMVQDAFFKQEEIVINMSSFTTWLGDHMVDTPNLDESMKDGKWVIVPKPLPEPLKLKFYIKGNPDISILDYLELSVSGKEGSRFILADNSRQENTPLLISLKLPISDAAENEAKINVKLKLGQESNVKANLTLLRFLTSVTGSGKATIAFKNLTEDKDFIVASSFSFDGNTKDLDKDYQFIKRLSKLESHFNLTFTVPEEMDKSDWEAIEILEHMKKNKPIKRNLQKLTANLDDKETIQNLVDLFEKDENVKKLMIEQSGSEARIELFDEVIPLEKLQTIYNSLKIDDLDRVKKKIAYMDEGESIKITFLPGDDPEFNEYYFAKINDN